MKAKRKQQENITQPKMRALRSFHHYVEDRLTTDGVPLSVPYPANSGEGEKRETKSRRYPNQGPSPDAKQAVRDCG